jgi:hypothetical protein
LYNLQAGGHINRNQDFLIDLSFPTPGITEFTSLFTMDFSFELSFALDGLPLEPEGIPKCVANLGLWEDPSCI